MYSIELSDLYPGQLQTEVLAAIENICNDHKLEDHFGTISMAMHDILDDIIRHHSDDYSETDVSFFIDSQELSVLVHHSCPLSEIKANLEKETINTESQFFALSKLVDDISFSNQDQEISLTFHVKPNMNGVGESNVSEIEGLLTTEEVEEEMRRKND
ncbi:hypothetical protein LJC53_06180 [Bacteroidales bacterium OttesenSCG-928-C03]|nr:hypothetical protein [Bacteroidales bacterium OttesenSCG-928-E04]MDL2309153.1 hypothetical protein [Bacteroidales bacterium OttesenSCG-928-C03]MDL2326962.1 hypothetical protein [Bacteroidales bacterium OttesenSCG-928-A14]